MHFGSFKWLVMPEGLTNAPAPLQRFMNDIFVNIINVIVIIYLDDILIYSNHISKHKAHIQEVLCRLHANGIFTHVDKCKFHVTSCEYLRYMLSPEGLTMAPYKVQIIQGWPVPWKAKDIQSQFTVERERSIKVIEVQECLWCTVDYSYI